jgi:hypothetical protein
MFTDPSLFLQLARQRNVSDETWDEQRRGNGWFSGMDGIVPASVFFMLDEISFLMVR